MRNREIAHLPDDDADAKSVSESLDLVMLDVFACELSIPRSTIQRTVLARPPDGFAPRFDDSDERLVNGFVPLRLNLSLPMFSSLYIT